MSVEQLKHGEAGQGLLEYGLVLILVSAAGVLVMSPLGASISDLFAAVTGVFP